jgi:hypothetical protein
LTWYKYLAKTLFFLYFVCAQVHFELEAFGVAQSLPDQTRNLAPLHMVADKYAWADRHINAYSSF